MSKILLIKIKMEKSISLVALADTNIKKTIYALIKSQKNLKFNKILLITSQNIQKIFIQ